MAIDCGTEQIGNTKETHRVPSVLGTKNRTHTQTRQNVHNPLGELRERKGYRKKRKKRKERKERKGGSKIQV